MINQKKYLYGLKQIIFTKEISKDLKILIIKNISKWYMDKEIYKITQCYKFFLQYC